MKEKKVREQREVEGLAQIAREAQVDLDFNKGLTRAVGQTGKVL